MIISTPILDRANGLLFEKDEKSLFEKIMWMYNNKDQMSLLSYNARYFKNGIRYE